MGRLSSLASLLLKVAGVLLAAVLLLGIALVVWIHRSGEAATIAAKQFCDRVETGQPVAELLVRAEDEDVLYSTASDGSLRFRFPAWGRGICEVRQHDGRVTEKKAWYEDWD